MATRGELWRAAKWMRQQAAKEKREGKEDAADVLLRAAEYTIAVGYDGESS